MKNTVASHPAVSRPRARRRASCIQHPDSTLGEAEGRGLQSSIQDRPAAPKASKTDSNETTHKAPISEEEILTAIRSIAKETKGGRVRLKRFLAKTNLLPVDIYRHFASWNGAVAAAGFDCRDQRRYSEDDELLKDWGAVARMLKGQPSFSFYEHNGKYSATTLQNRFKTWYNAGQAFRAFAEGKEEWADVLQLLPPPRLRRRGTHGRVHLLRRMRGRKAAAPAKPMKDRPTFGDPVDDFPGLLNAPTNETGVIMVFGMLAERLGFHMRSLRVAFPDCIAMRWVGATVWQEVTIEFEYESRNFRAHGHPPGGCDILICWTHNWEECPVSLEVIALSEELERLRGEEDFSVAAATCSHVRVARP